MVAFFGSKCIDKGHSRLFGVLHTGIGITCMAAVMVICHCSRVVYYQHNSTCMGVGVRRRCKSQCNVKIVFNRVAGCVFKRFYGFADFNIGIISNGFFATVVLHLPGCFIGRVGSNSSGRCRQCTKGQNA